MSEKNDYFRTLFCSIMHKSVRFLFVLFAICLMLFEGNLSAQTNDDKITEQKAFQFYQQKNYTDALPLFSQLLSLYPKDERYNLHYAACLIETNQGIDKAIKYLQFADSKSNDPIIKYYLGRAYHLSYQFKEAIENYTAFIQLAPSKQVKELAVNKQVEMCQNGLELIKYISDLTVVDNRRIKSENYFYSYDLKEFDGKLVIKPKELKSAIDKKEEPANMVIFLPNNSNTIYYGSYGTNKLNGKDLYRIERLADGKWGKPQNLGTVINSPFDEDYPFLHADGKTLYFSSKGHNSMGGYDIFKSEFDSTAMTWSNPINLDFPINTPYDDYLYITDKDNFYAFFTSNRETRDNNITVYKILVDKNPIKREFKDLEEIMNVSRLEVSSLADIKKAEESKQKNKINEPDIIFANNESNNSNINISLYSFKPISYKSNLTSQEVANNLKADNEKIEKNANEIKRQSQLAYFSAKENNEKANQKRKEAYEKNATLKNITDPVEAEQAKQEIYQLINDAEDLERQAITAYNIAQNFEEIAAEMNKDINKSQNFIHAIEKQGVVDEAVVDAANKNKERLELSQKKYSSLQKKFEDRKNLQKAKENELYTYEEMLNNSTDSINQIDEQIKELETKIKNSNSETEKNYLALQVDELNKRSDMLEAKQIEIAELIEKTKLDIENLNSENQFLKQFAEKAIEDKRSIDELSKEPIAKEQLKKDIFEKELSADITVAQTVKEKVGQKSISKNKQIAQNKSKSTDNTTVSNLSTNDTAQKTETSLASNQTTGNNNLIKGVNPLLPNTTTTNKATAENIEKEQFNIQYYTNIVNEQQQKLELINNAINKAKDKKEKQLLEQQKNYLVEEIQNHKQLLSQSQQKLNEYKNILANKVDTSISISNEELVLKASKYDNKYEINFSLVQKKQLEQAEQEKQDIKNLQKQLKANASEIKRLEWLKISINDNAEQKNVENQIVELKNQQAQLYRNYTTKIDNNNKNTFNIYNQVLTTVRNYNTESSEVKTANLVEKEIEALNEKASQLKREALLMNDMNEKVERYKKADIIEQIAIQKQKYAIDLYVSSRQNIAQASNNNLNNTNQTTQTEKTLAQDDKKSISIELSPEENKQLAEYQTEKAKAEIKLSQGKSLYKEIEEKRNLAAKTYSTAKKKEILKDVDKKEQEAINLLMDAHNIYEQANSKKHQVYQEKIKQLLENPNVIDDNKTIAIQFLKESDFYYDEAQQVRLRSKTAATNEDKVALLNKALLMEQKAISNQEYAVDAMTNAEPVEFVATNNLTKIDKLEALDKQVDVEDVIRIKTERIIANLNLSVPEKIKLDEAIVKQQTISQLTTEAEKYKAKLELAKEIAKNSTNKNEKKKAEKSIPKLEKEYFSRKFTAAELTENVNDSYYKLYETKFTEIRPKDKSEDTKQGKQLEKNANKKYIQAKQLREKSFITENPYIAYNYLLQADSIEKSAIEDQEKAFGLYLKLKPLDDEIREYVEKHPRKRPIDDLIVLKTTADITPISKEELAQIEEKQSNNNNKSLNNNQVEASNTETNINQTKELTNQDENLNKDKNINQTAVEENQIKNTDANTNQIKELTNQDENLNEDKNINQTEKFENQIKNSNEDTQISQTIEKNNQVEASNTELNINQSKETNKTENLINDQQNNQVITENKTTTNTVVSNESKSIIPVNVTTPMGFSFMAQSQYSEANPIPINPPLPEGLIFKVQIGAFNNPVKENSFNGLSPVSAEKLEGSKYYRYFVGMFYSEPAAIMVRDYIRPMGYKDAFVVAFYNGKRITLFEARQLIKQNATPEYEKLAQDESIKITSVTSVSPTMIVQQKQAENPIITNNQFALGSLVNETKELFYTVQIGVFKTPVSHKALKNLSPLYEDHSYNFIRYLVGKFNNRKEAEVEKNKIVALGITDAFVSAYYKGQKITLAEAASIEAMNPNAIISKSDNVNIIHENNVIHDETTINVGNVDINNLYYKVQIGSFKDKVPFNIAAKFVQISSQYGIDQQIEEGATVYYAGKFKSYDEASQCKNSLTNQGFKDAFVIATDGKQKIPIKQARELLHQ